MAFVNFADLITFTRASSGTRVNASGVIETITSGNPRFDYDPISLEPRGLLIEEQRTNLAVRASDYSTGWGALTGISLTTGQASPDGGSNATRVECTTNGATRIVTQTITVANGVVHVFSVFLKKGTTNYGGLAVTDSGATNQAAWTFDLNAGAVGQNLVTTIASTAGIMSVGGGWYRCWVMTTSPGTSIQARIIPTNSAASLNGAIGDNIIVFGAQVEAGSFATSFIPTVASQVTRSADVATVGGEDFSGFYNPSEGTFVVEYQLDKLVSSQCLLHVTDIAENNRIRIMAYTGGVSRASIKYGGNEVATLDVSGSAVGISRVALAYKAGSYGFTRNGAAVVTNFASVIPSGPTEMRIGRDASGSLINDWIASIRYFPERLPDYVLREMTT